jgi:uncharacterized protein (UPF0332 family)
MARKLLRGEQKGSALEKGKYDTNCSKPLPKSNLMAVILDLFDARMKSDYRDFAEVSEEDARNAVSAAQEFVSAIKALTE